MSVFKDVAELPHDFLRGAEDVVQGVTGAIRRLPSFVDAFARVLDSSRYIALAALVTAVIIYAPKR